MFFLRAGRVVMHGSGTTRANAKRELHAARKMISSRGLLAIRVLLSWEGRLSRIHFPTEFISTISWVAFYVRSKVTRLGGRENWSIGTWQRIKTRKTTSVTSPATQAMFLLKTNLSVLFVMRIKIECKISYLQYKENQTTVFCFWRAWKIKK